MTKELIRFGMTLVQHVPVSTVDALLLMIANAIFGDLSRHGIVRPKVGPLLLKSKTGRSAVIDVGTVRLIKEEVIKVSVLSRYISSYYEKFLTSSDVKIYLYIR